MITKKDFQEDNFYEGRNTKKQEIVLNFLLNDQEHAFTTKEIAKELYGSDDNKSTAKAYYLLVRLEKKGFVEKKMPYWMIKKREINIP